MVVTWVTFDSGTCSKTTSCVCCAERGSVQSNNIILNAPLHLQFTHIENYTFCLKVYLIVFIHFVVVSDFPQNNKALA